ncbi:ceramidase domain-containing protein [Aureimonas pseudogalii]|uniref:Ceramidase n=1 Tax=Aureimonas pseudogalii TaxID=1744844 RepID=A0A7W6ECW3_9HYPH|nr:ceramidase domain-containing protein [Aureimonas pseudogalii]MBB3997706.1 hypothetical protein [Aureimonas pseudogalii]
MDWFGPIDAYCERTSAAVWAEPVNAFSNLAFLLAALWAWRRWRKLEPGERGGDRVVPALIGLVAVIGVGSTLFHTLANGWSMLADVVPITLFIAAYFALALRRLVGLRRWASAGGTIAFLVAAQGVEPLAAPLVGSSAAYVPALAALFGIGGWLGHRGHPAARLVLAAGGVFALSLTARTLDGPLCAALPLGLHFLWHGLNALVLALLLAAAMPAPSKR